MPKRYVLDASALLCLLNDEAGAEKVEAAFDDAVISAVNLSEVVAKIVERGGTAEIVTAMLDPLRFDVVAFDRAQAIRAGELRAATRGARLSFGDRACLALADICQWIALTADRAWGQLDLSVRIELIR